MSHVEVSNTEAAKSKDVQNEYLESNHTYCGWLLRNFFSQQKISVTQNFEPKLRRRSLRGILLLLRIHVGWAIDQSWRGTIQTHTYEKVNLRAQKTDRTRRMLERKGREWEFVTDNLVSFFVTNRNDTSREGNRCYVCTLS